MYRGFMKKVSSPSQTPALKSNDQEYDLCALTNIDPTAHDQHMPRKLYFKMCCPVVGTLPEAN